MPLNQTAVNQVRERRISMGLTQATLAERAGISRTAVTAIEGERLIPSVVSALALAKLLHCTVEQLFSNNKDASNSEVWAWEPTGNSMRYWRAEVAGKTVMYPAISTPMVTPLPDEMGAGISTPSEETLVMACCDPAAGLLASQFAKMTGMRLLVIPRSSRKAVEMLKNGLVHLAGLHLSTEEEPDMNSQVIRESLGQGYAMMRVAKWQEGIAVSTIKKLRSARAAKKAKFTWIGREPGSGARQCLDRLLDDRRVIRRIAQHHRGVAEAVQLGWADAGVCVQLVSAEAGLDFLPVQEEAYDVCYSRSLADDRRIKAFLRVIRSAAYRKILSELPGYNCSETGTVWSAD